MDDGAGLLQWAPKIPRWKIRQLYETDARGIVDAERIDDVGWALWGRCDSILTVTAAHYGQVRCPACGAGIVREHAWAKDERVSCPACAWEVSWAAYHQSYRGKQLFGANALEVFATYHRAFPLAQAAPAKMLLIDALIHAFHVGLAEEIGRPAAANLLEGSLADVIQFLDALTSGAASDTGFGDSQAAWRATLDAVDWAKPFRSGAADAPGPSAAS